MWSQKLEFWLFQHEGVLLFVTLSPSCLSVDTHTRIRPKETFVFGSNTTTSIKLCLDCCVKSSMLSHNFNIFLAPSSPLHVTQRHTTTGLPKFDVMTTPMSTSLPLLRCKHSIDYRFTGRLNSFDCGQVSIFLIHSLHINISFHACRHSIQPLLVTVEVSLGSSKTVFVQKPRRIHFNV